MRRSFSVSSFRTIDGGLGVLRSPRLHSRCAIAVQRKIFGK
jgi:hypothetical protein